jgi:hypothetical protein
MASDPPLASYPVRTAPGYWFAAIVLFVFALVGTRVLTFVIIHSGGEVAGLSRWYWIVAGLCTLAPLAYWLATPAYRIGRGRGAITFHADRIEVPPPAGGPMLVFPRAGLTVSSTVKNIRYRIGALAATTVRRGFLLTFRSGTRSRALSTLTVAEPARFLTDLERYLGGETAAAAVAAAEATPPTADDRLDAELANHD